MNSSKRYLENRILLPWFAKVLKHFMKKMLPFFLIVIGCFCHVTNNHPPLPSPRKNDVKVKNTAKYGVRRFYF